MGVRVRVRIEYGNREVDVVGLLNTGFEGDVPEILIPIHVAEALGLWPKLPEGTIVETYRTASGLMRVFRIPGGKVRLITEEGVRDPILAYIVISEYTDEVLINDQMISRLGIVIEDPAKGLWRLKNENKIRRSVV